MFSENSNWHKYKNLNCIVRYLWEMKLIYSDAFSRSISRFFQMEYIYRFHRIHEDVILDRRIEGCWMQHGWDGPDTSSTQKSALRPREIHLPGGVLDSLLVKSALSTSVLLSVTFAMWVRSVFDSSSSSRDLFFFLFCGSNCGSFTCDMVSLDWFLCVVLVHCLVVVVEQSS